MYQINFSKLVKILSLNIILVVIVLSLSRVIFLYNIVDFEQLAYYKDDLFNVFFLGARYDLKVATIGFSLSILVGMATAASNTYFLRFLKFFRIYSALIFLLLIMCSIGNYYYYQTYGNPFDVFIFGLFDDDTIAILKSVWVDYPVIKASLLVGALIWLFLYLNKKITKNISAKPPLFTNYYWATISSFLFILIIFIAARGTLGTHPLKRYHANASDYITFNKVIPNALVLLDWAYTDYKKATRFTMVDSDTYMKQLVKITGKDRVVSSVEQNLFLENNPPHVVLALMESLGTSVLKMDGKDEKLLGGLQTHFNQDFLFSRFYAQSYGTLDTLVDMLVHSNVPNIGSSTAQEIVIPEASMFPYQKAGYETIFIYGGNGMWRNIYNYFPRQGFDVVHDENSIIDRFPEAENSAGDWGVADEYTFKFAQYLLDKAVKPTFIYIMTVTNHSPHAVPNDASVTPIKVDQHLKNISQLKSEKLQRLLETYQYSANELGKFISNIKTSELATNTIIAASGDHRVRSMKKETLFQKATASQVPLYLYVPQAVLDHVNYSYQPLRVGSHKDLFPTLYHLSLSGISYSSLGGNDLLSSDDKKLFWAYSPEGVFSEYGARLTSNPDKLMPWQEASNRFKEPIEYDGPIKFTAQDYNHLKTLFINQAIKGYKNDN